MFVKPKAGIKIRFPDRPSRILPEEGADVPKTSFWMRRLKEESIIKNPCHVSRVACDEPLSKE